MVLPHLCAVTATYNRHEHLERTVRYFLDQDYAGKHTLLIFNNHERPLVLDEIELPDHKKILLINRHLDREFFQPYKDLGTIYADAISYIPKDAEVVTFQDDDDTFLPNHYSEGIKGFLKAKALGKLAYKPHKSFFRGVDWETVLVSNTLEPSIFVEADHLMFHRFLPATTNQHMRWLQPLIDNDQILVDYEGTPTMIYNWMGDVYKTSGDPDNPKNFENCRNHGGDLGDGIVTPATTEQVAPFYVCTQKSATI